jgi:hypothetical protein
MKNWQSSGDINQKYLDVMYLLEWQISRNGEARDAPAN